MPEGQLPEPQSPQSDSAESIIKESPLIKPPKKKSNFHLPILVLIVSLILISIPLSVYLVKQRQEIRKMASGCGAAGQACCDNDNTPNAIPYAHGCDSGLDCLQGNRQANGDEVGTCTPRGGGGGTGTGTGGGGGGEQRCPPGDQGQPGETCSKLNRCDKGGGCNSACCSNNDDCPGNQVCDVPNGYCRSPGRDQGYSCRNPNTEQYQGCVGNQCVWTIEQGHAHCSSDADCGGGNNGGNNNGNNNCGGEGQACCDNDNTPNAIPYAHGCDSGLDCLVDGRQANGDERGTCQQQGGANCTGSCNRSGCSNSNCSNGPGSYYCHGYHEEGCNMNMSSYYQNGGGSIDYGQSHWCSTVQADANAENKCIVVYIGDHGEWCVSSACNRNPECGGFIGCPGGAGSCDRNGDGKIDRNDLDWDCANITPTPQPTAQCNWIRAYNSNWQQLGQEGLSNLQPGDHVYFSVLGGRTGIGTLDRARFRVNYGSWQETTTHRPGTQQFYVEYVIPAGVTDFTVEAEVHHTVLGWR